MGLRISPYYMQMWLNQVVEFLRSTRAFVWGHMDDIIVIGTKQQLDDVIGVCLPQLTATGVQINKDKSNLKPTRRLIFCGALWDLDAQVITITNAKKRKLRQAVQAWPAADDKTKEKIMGFLAYLWPLIEDNWATLRPMYHDDSRWQDVSARIDQSRGTISLKFKTRRKSEDIFVDATPTAIGIATEQITFHAAIPESGILKAEAAVLLVGLQMAKRNAVVHTDNQPLYYMIRNRKTKSPELYDWLTKCLCLINHKNIFVRWVPSENNPADQPSRCGCAA